MTTFRDHADLRDYAHTQASSGVTFQKCWMLSPEPKLWEIRRDTWRRTVGLLPPKAAG